MSSDLIAYLLTFAIKFSGLPAIEPAELPPMLPKSREELTATICPEGGCDGIQAWYDTDGNRILYLNTLDLDDPDDNSFILHEFVHVLQYRAKGSVIYQNCAALFKTEREAYDAQNKYLQHEGRLSRVGEILRFSTCHDAVYLQPGPVYNLTMSMR